MSPKLNYLLSLPVTGYSTSSQLILNSRKKRQFYFLLLTTETLKIKRKISHLTKLFRNKMNHKSFETCNNETFLIVLNYHVLSIPTNANTNNRETNAKIHFVVAIISSNHFSKVLTCPPKKFSNFIDDRTSCAF